MELCELEATVTDPSEPEAAAMVKAMEAEMEDQVHPLDLAGDLVEALEPAATDGPAVDADEDVAPVWRTHAIGVGPLRVDRDESIRVPEVRGRGLSRSLLAALEDRAREMGFEVARLDTADRQPAAKRLYESAGYRSIPMYNGNRFARFWFEREL